MGSELGLAHVGVLVGMVFPPSGAALGDALAGQEGAEQTPAGISVRSRGILCPSPAQVETALRLAFAGSINTGPSWVLSYGSGESAPEEKSNGTITMELLDPAGRRACSRWIPDAEGDCPAMAGVMAAVVERYLRSLGWTRGTPLPDAPTSMIEPSSSAQADRALAPPPNPSSSRLPAPQQPVGSQLPTPPPATKARVPPQTESPSPPAPINDVAPPSSKSAAVPQPPMGEVPTAPPRVVLGAGYVLGTSTRLGSNVLVDACVRVAGPVALRLGGFILATHESQAVRLGSGPVFFAA